MTQEAIAKELYEALKTVEWVEYNDPDYGQQVFCAECRTSKKHNHGHDFDCSVGKAIAAYEQSITEPLEE